VVVDDERDILTLICSLLEEEGYTVICLTHPVETSRLEGRDPHLFVLDIMLPAMSGISLAAQLRQNGYSTTPMIAMSASPAMLKLAEESTFFQGTLHKPFDLDGFIHAVEQHLRAS
jgi:CheY-like chemotaxis protein